MVWSISYSSCFLDNQFLSLRPKPGAGEMCTLYLPWVSFPRAVLYLANSPVIIWCVELLPAYWPFLWTCVSSESSLLSWRNVGDSKGLNWLQMYSCFQPQISKINCSSIWHLARSLDDLFPRFYAESFEDLSKEDGDVHTGDWVELTKVNWNTWLSMATAVSILPPVFPPGHSSVTRFLHPLSWFWYYV